MRCFPLLLTGLLAAAVPLEAATSTFYFVAKEVSHDGVDVSTELTVANPEGAPLSFTILTLPAGIDKDGTDRQEGAEVTFEVPPLQTRVLTDLIDTGEALVEISAPEELVFRAELVPRASGERGTIAQIPIINSESLFLPGQSAFIQNIELVTNLSVANLGGTEASCNYTVRFADGNLEGSYQFTHAPLSVAYFRDVLALIGDSGRSYVRVRVTCDQDFYVFGDMLDVQRAELAVLLPSQTGLSTLRPPGQLPVCPSNATCWDLDGPFVPRAGEEHLEVVIPLPQGAYDRIHLQMDVTHGGWNGGGGGLYNVFYLAFNKSWRETIGYVQFKQSDQVYFRHGIDPKGDKTIFKRVVGELIPGQTYHLDYLFDMKNGVSELIISADGVEVSRFRSSPRVRRFDIGPGGYVFLELSLPRNSAFALDRPSYGWVHDNLHIEFQQR